MKGLILKGIGGFYYIEYENEIYCCKPRGIFRKEDISPTVGDFVEFIAGQEGSEGSIEEIFPRKNKLTRPALANIDKLFIIVSTVAPNPNLLIVDKTIAIAQLKGIEPIIVISKNDVKKRPEIESIYKKIGYKVFLVSLEVVPEDLKEEFKDCVCAVTGNSGAGKSTLLNNLFKDFNLQTGVTSKKLGRGKHTTRHTELLKIDKNSYVADTPGFSIIELQKYEIQDPSEIVSGFKEFESYLGKCKFVSCTHTCEKYCSVLEAVENGEIDATRHQNYIAMYNELKGVKAW